MSDDFKAIECRREEEKIVHDAWVK
jgi:hypothetical protein